MPVGDLAQWGAVIVIAIGLLASWVRNGRAGYREKESLKLELKMQLGHIRDKLDDPNEGLAAIKQTVTAQQLHCASFTSNIAARVENLESTKEHRRK